MSKDIIPPHIIIVGHRGASAYAPENTLSSIKKALAYGVSMIEFDVHQCASGQTVVIHDFDVSKTTNGDGMVALINYDKLRSLRIAEHEHIPTLREVLDAINRKAIAVIELKGQKTAQPVAETIQEYVTQRGWSYTDFLVVSFDHAQLQTIKKIVPEIPIGPTIYGIPADPIAYTKKIGARLLSLHPAFITQQLVQEAHENNISIFIWYHGTKADIWHAQQAIECNIDGLFADAPDKPLTLQQL